MKEYFGNRAGALFAVFDGHGHNGHDVARTAMAVVPRLIAASPHFHSRAIADAFPHVFQAANAQIAAQAYCSELSGTTAIVAHVSQLGTLTVGSAGDSRCVIGTLDS